VFCMYTDCTQPGEQHFQHFLQHWWVFITLSKGYSHCDSLLPS
jgi:hypothetical protein